MNISLQTSLCNLLEILRFAGSHTRSVVNHRGKKKKKERKKRSADRNEDRRIG